MINNHHPLITYTAYTSIIVQIFTTILGVHGILIPLSKDHQIIKDIMVMETVVQIIELCFYITLIYYLFNIRNELTYTRYFDWALSTPIMLLSTVLFFQYNNHRTTNTSQKSAPPTTMGIISKYKTPILTFTIANWVMLLCGFLGERKAIPRVSGFFFGSAAFLYSFYVIYKTFVGTSTINHILFLFMFGIWACYGFAYLAPYYVKNALYNVLDIFAKNFYGIFIYWKILQLRPL